MKILLTGYLNNFHGHFHFFRVHINPTFLFFLNIYTQHPFFFLSFATSLSLSVSLSHLFSPEWGLIEFFSWRKKCFHQMNPSKYCIPTSHPIFCTFLIKDRLRLRSQTPISRIHLTSYLMHPFFPSSLQFIRPCMSPTWPVISSLKHSLFSLPTFFFIRKNFDVNMALKIYS